LIVANPETSLLLVLLTVQVSTESMMAVSAAPGTPCGVHALAVLKLPFAAFFQ